MHLCGLDIHAFDGARNGRLDTPGPRVKPCGCSRHCGLPTMCTLRCFLMLTPSASRYTRQLVMESLGKESNRRRPIVRAQRSEIRGVPTNTLIQQLRDGPLGVACHFVSVEATPQPSALLDDAADLQFALMTSTQHACRRSDRSWSHPCSGAQ